MDPSVVFDCEKVPSNRFALAMAAAILLSGSLVASS